jgi:Bacterial Ig-like domain/Cadherin-like domain
MRTRLRSKFTLLFIVCGVLVAVSAVVAMADQLRDELTAATPTATITQNDPNGFDNTYHLDATGQGPNVSGQCDVNATNPATFKINTPVGVTATPNTLTFTQCGTATTNTQDVKFTASVANTTGYTITATQTAGANFPSDTIQTPNATFTLKVNPDTTKPTVTAVSPTGTSEPVGTNVEATFSEAMDAATLNDAEGDGNFTLKKTSDNSLVGAVVSYNATDKKATLNPNADLAYNTQYTATVSTGAKDLAGNALDQDGAAGTQDSKTWSFTTEPPPNSPPVANDVSATTNEDNSVTITLSGTDADGNNLTFSTVAGQGPTHGSLGPIVPTGPTTATVNYTPDQDFNGPDSFKYRANDGTVDSAEKTVSITVSPVNDAPSFTAGPNQTVNEDSGAKTVDPWATGISKGPADEASQTVSFVVTDNSNPDLFSAGPAVSNSGALSFTPAANAFGTATVSVKITDNGGTANGGVNESTVQTFTIDVDYKFDGFRQPVDMNGVFNSAKAGQSIPMKFSLFGNKGLSILQPSTPLLPNPKVTSVTCPGASVAVDPIEEYATTTANNGLTYDATADQYNYVWKTQSTYANKCFKFDMVLIDGTHHEAYFKFLK